MLRQIRQRQEVRMREVGGEVNFSCGDFQKDILHFADSVRDRSTFAYVTLVAEDDYQIEANQLVLSAASPFFKRILSESRDSHRLIYLVDVFKQQLKSIVNFIYHGEVKIPEEYLKSFMAVSEDLQIKDLLESFVGEDAEPMSGQYIFTEKEEEAEKIIKQRHKRQYLWRRNQLTQLKRHQQKFLLLLIL